MYFQVHFQTNTYVILSFVYFHQEPYYQSHIDLSHRFQYIGFMCLRLCTYFLIFLKSNLIHFMIMNIIVLFLYVIYIFSCGILPAFLSRPDFIILRIKVYQDLKFIWWMDRDMDTIGYFWYILWMINISFSALARTFTLKHQTS